MKSRVYMIVPLLVIGLAMPVCAQQISEREANEAAKNVADAFVKAVHEKDAAEQGYLSCASI
jgi:hypothetical protein